jgi:protoheme IX farnesyltransferase
MKWIKTYFFLTKPGIIAGNLMAMFAGFFVACKNGISVSLLLATVLGISFIIAAGCVCNNYIDRDIDKKMERTRNRALATGKISLTSAIIYASILLLIGLTILFIFTNAKTTLIGLIGFIVYVFLYSLMKYKTVHATLIGSIAGAMPPLVGYTAVSNQIDQISLSLFLLLVFWQMPHFYSITLYRLRDYEAASIPVLAVKKGLMRTKLEMILYILLFGFVCLMLGKQAKLGAIFAIATSLLSIGWIGLWLHGFKEDSLHEWAHRMFKYSLIVISSISILIPIIKIAKLY